MKNVVFAAGLLLLLSGSPNEQHLRASDSETLIDSIRTQLQLLKAEYLTRIRDRDARYEAMMIVDHIDELLDELSGSPSAPQPMSEEEFSQLLDAISDEFTDSDKLRMLKTAMSGDVLVTVNQIARVMDQFTFDDSKVKAVRVMYSHVVDPQNGYKLLSKVMFSDSKEEIKRIISG